MTESTHTLTALVVHRLIRAAEAPSQLELRPAPNPLDDASARLMERLCRYFAERPGKGFGHSSARQAGETATACGAKSLYLIHYQVWNTDPAPLVAEAQETYAGPVHLCADFDEYEF